MYKKYMIFVAIIVIIAFVEVIVVSRVDFPKKNEVVSITYNYWNDYGKNTQYENYYRNQMFYVSGDESYRFSRALNTSDESNIKIIDKKYFSQLEQIINDNNVEAWNEFDKELNIGYRTCFFMEIRYKDGKRIYARGLGDLPANYEKVSNELINLLDKIKVCVSNFMVLIL